MNTIRFAAAVALICAFSSWQLAWAEAEDYLPQEQHEGDVTWISGGIGKEEADAMRGVASQYNLRLTLVETQNGHSAFLSGAAVKISDAKGNVVLAVTDVGPFVFLKLAPGGYNVSADTAGRRLAKAVRVENKAAKEIMLVWPRRVN